MLTKEREKELKEYYENKLDFLESEDFIIDGETYTVKCTIGWNINDFLEVDPSILKERHEHLIKAITPEINRRVKAGVFNQGVIRIKKINISKTLDKK